MAELPNLAPRAATTRREFHAFVIEHAGSFLVTQRPTGVVNAGLWEFPNCEVTERNATPEVSLQENFQLAAPCALFTTVTHSITRYRITQRVFRVRLTARPKVMKENLQWFELAALLHLPFTSAHKRVLTRFVGG